MADQESTNTASTDVDTPQTEETQVTDSGDTTAEETKEETEGDGEAEAQGEESEAGDDAEKPEEDEVKRRNNEMAQKRIQERQERQGKIDQDQQKYLEQAEDEKDLALRQLQVNAYNQAVERNTDKLTSSFERAVSNIDLFQNPTPEIAAELDSAIDAFQAMHVQIDQNGNPVKVTGDLYEFLNKRADSIRRLTQMGARNEKIAGAKTKSATMTPPASAPPKPKDRLMELWDS